MSKKLVRFLSAFLAAIMIFCTVPCLVAFAAEEIEEAGEQEIVIPVITVSADSREVVIRGTKQLSCNESGVTWSSSNMNVGTVDQNGLFTAKGVGRTTITASKKVGETVAKGTFEICVTQPHTLPMDFISDHNLLSYKYSYVDDYFYTDKYNSWQKRFGYNKLYDLAAPYILLEYDYVRVHFEYAGKDWMVQLWKGQYGLVFYGCETGIYSKDHSDEDDTVVTTYMGTDESDWLGMKTELYHDKTGNGDYQLEFTCDEEQNWWQTGFKPGHLRRQEPANELRMVGKLTFKDEEMAEAFAKGFENCGFKRTEKCDQPGLDSFYVDGKTVNYNWQDNSEAENTMAIKTTGATLFFLNTAAFFGAILFVLFSIFSLGFIALVIL